MLECERAGEALASLDRAIALKGDFAEAHISRGNVLRRLGDLAGALASYDRALTIQPMDPDAHLNRAVVMLLEERFEQGWPSYEFRDRASDYRKRAATVMPRYAPDWDGSSSDGALLVLPEQGIGDQIFYAGMLRELHERAARLTVCLDPRLLDLFGRSFPGVAFRRLGAWEPEERFDYQVQLPSLGRIFRSSQSAFSRVHVPYLFADRAQAQSLRARLAQPGRLTCGLSWISKNRELRSDKSLTLDRLQGILGLPSIDFVDLQYGDTSEEQERFCARTGIALQRIPEIDNFRDIDALAALIDACDVVLTVSNTTAHLAAALGKPVLILVPHATRLGLLWYWHLDRRDSAWYPTASLYRQGADASWDEALRALERDLLSFPTPPR